MPFIEILLYVWSHVILTSTTSLSGRSDFHHFQIGKLGLSAGDVLKFEQLVTYAAGISTQVLWFVVQPALLLPD